MATAIEFNHVSKLYRLGLVSTGTFREDIKRWWITSMQKKEDPYLTIGETNDRGTKGESQFVWALRDIDFKVEQGDVVGIIGKNGAGKSTLLKLLSKITAPTTGDIRARGRIASLLEVGTGMHPEMTGRENIYLNGAILGMTKSEITRKLDEIIDFSGCERYIDTPVKRYSSGMRVRLGFAVAAHLDPDILVVDEVLAVGDAEFQKKAIGKMKEVSQGGGRTVLFVSHNMASVRNLCHNGIVLKDGCVDYVGAAENCIDYYLQSNKNNSCNICYTKIQPKDRQKKGSNLLELEFLEVRMVNDVDNVGTDEALILETTLKRNSLSVKKCQYTVSIKDENGDIVQGFLTLPIDVPEDRLTYSIRIQINNHGLTKGKYIVDMVAGTKDFSIGSRNYDRVENIIAFEVKYYNKQERMEYLIWENRWGSILHNGDLIECQVIQ